MPEPSGLRAGFIGLGVMGRPMAAHVLAAGFPLTVHSRSHGSVGALVAAGAIDGGSPAGVARSADIVVLMLPDPPDVAAVLFGSDGLVEGLQSGAVVVDMSTGDPQLARDWAERLAGHTVGFLDAPVSGGEAGAVAASLSIMVGGSEASLERARPVLAAMSQRIVHIGPSGAGQIAKAANQLVVAATIQAVAEALVLAAKAGVDPARVREALLGGFAASRVLELHGQRMIDGDFRPGGRVALHRKDARIIQGLARALGSPVPAFDVVANALESLVERGGGDLDHAALVTLLEDEAGIRVASVTERSL
jgi:2-hydroxy-3-oxopropionate reductase